jgi:flagellin
MAGRVEFNKKKLIDGSLADPTETVDGLKASLASLQAKRTAAFAAANPTAFMAAVTAYAGAQTTYAAAVSAYNTALGSYNTALSTYNAAGSAMETAQAAKDAAQLLYNANPAAPGAAASYTAALSAFAAAQSSYNAALSTYNTALASYNAALSTYNAAGSVYNAAENTFKTKQAEYLAAQEAVTKYDEQISAVNKHIAGIAADGEGTELYFQVGANANQKLVMNIASIKTSTLGIGDGSQDSVKGKSNDIINVVKATGSEITGMLDTLDQALSFVTTERSKLGAAQNRLEYTMNSLDISAENLTAAESRIRDVDMAKEMTNFTKQNILFQASIAMLAQANAFPQGVLQLLG